MGEYKRIKVKDFSWIKSHYLNGNLTLLDFPNLCGYGRELSSESGVRSKINGVSYPIIKVINKRG